MGMKRAFLCLGLCLAAVPALADMGALAPLLPPDGQEGAWVTARSDGAFAMANEGQAGALRYYYLNTPDGTDSKAAVTLDLTGSGDGFAGLIFGLDTQTRVYHIYAAHTDGSFSLYRRTPDGFSKLTSSTLGDLEAGPMTIGIAETGSSVSLNVNGKSMGSIDNDLLGDGGIGIVAGGIVSVTFTDFALANADR